MIRSIRLVSLWLIGMLFVSFAFVLVFLVTIHAL